LKPGESCQTLSGSTLLLQPAHQRQPDSRRLLNYVPNE
jgi:hypothetical protein